MEENVEIAKTKSYLLVVCFFEVLDTFEMSVCPSKNEESM